MGTTKVLLPWRGQPLIRHIVQVARASRLGQLIVVTGHEGAAVASALRAIDVRLVHNDRYREGLSGSLRAGIEALDGDVAAVLVMLADQPLLTAAVIDQLIERYRASAARIVAPFADGQRGNPVLFDRSLFGELRAVSGDQGARAVLQQRKDDVAAVEVSPDVLVDVDTPEAYEMLFIQHGAC
jgi:molybdenum cofactor cytidylyltransferase